MKIGIIDAEIMGKSKHRFPNLACMKISAYHKELGDDVTLLLDYDDIEKYDKVYVSKVFVKTDIPNEPQEKNKTEKNVIEYYSSNSFLKQNNIEFGGTGFFYEKSPKLKPEIEHHMPDYHIYDKWVEDCISKGAKEKEFAYYKDYSIGFVTRGCFRQCQFCINRIYKKCVSHSPLDEFMDTSRPKLCFLDDNFFACPDWREIIKEVLTTGKRFQFKQGLDERLLTEEKANMISQWAKKYDGDFIFAFDNIKDKDLIEEKLSMLRKYYSINKQNVKFYCFCGYDREGKYDDTFWKQDIVDLFERIFILAKYNCKPYIMRHENYNQSPFRGMYINIAAWCNQPNIFFNMSYYDMCLRDDTRRKNDKTSSTWRYQENFSNKYPEVAEKYYNMIPSNVK